MTIARAFAWYAVFWWLHLLAALATKPVWMDEALTFFQVAGKSWPEFLTAMHEGDNALPYAYFVSVWMLGQWVPLTPFWLRVPSTLFALAATLTSHVLLARMFGSVIAFAACSSALLLSEGFAFHASDARPYSLYAWSFAIALVAGQAALTARTKLTAGGFAAIALFVLPSSHFVGLACAGLLAVALAISAWPDQRRLTILAAGGTLGLTAFALLHITLLRVLFTMPYGRTAWIPIPTLRDVFWSPMTQLSLGPLIGLLFAFGLAWSCFPRYTEPSATARGRERSNESDHPDHCERHWNPFARPTSGADPMRFVALASVLTLLLPGMLAFMAVVGLPNFHLNRYWIPLHVAIAVVSGFALAALFQVVPQREAFSRWANRLTCVSLLLAMIPMVGDYFIFEHTELERRAGGSFAPTHLIAEPVATDDIGVYLELLYYGIPKERLISLSETRVGSLALAEDEARRLPTPLFGGGHLEEHAAFVFVQNREDGNKEFDITRWAERKGYLTRRLPVDAEKPIHHVQRP